MSLFNKLVQGALKQKTAAVYLIGNILAAAVPLILLPVLTRILDTKEYGKIAVFQAVVTLSLAIVGLATGGAIKRHFFTTQDKNPEMDYAQYVAAALTILAITFAFMLALVIVLGPSGEPYIGLETPVIALGVVAASTGFIVNIRLADYQIRGQPLPFAVFQVGQSLTNLLISIAIVFFIFQTAKGRILGIVISSGLVACIAMFSLLRDKRIHFPPKVGMIRDAAMFGAPLIPHTIGQFLLGSFDRFVLQTYEGLEAVGLYAAAIQLTFIIRVINDAINKTFQPWLFDKLSGTNVENAEIVGIYYQLIAMTFIIAVIFGLTSGWIIALLLGPQFAQAGSILPILALGMAFHGVYLFLVNILMYERRTGALALSTIFLGLLQVILLFVLVPAFGIMGAAIAFTVASAFRAGGILTLCHIVYPMPWFNPKFRRN
ncbi:putative membrane protein [Algimonas arctica]|uniref:Putative membrane protein n=1 Tax=Algimonas arctica TaxID=1479486 RepID=A0A8J3CP94_9PROT|nr:oligosaccharide flippase family protein [Algimonas arctica]GHA85094.1 putative membrane protein [Algimonas arctica]